MSDTIFYKGKLKRGKTPEDAFEKIRKSVKKKGPTKGWDCTTDGQALCISFPDGMSEDFVLQFDEKGGFDGFCKVFFPLEGELFEGGKSEFKALLDALYAANSLFAKVEISDDYGLAESYWDSKKYKFEFRELTPEETARVRRLYEAGNTSHEQLLRAVIAEDLQMTAGEIAEYVNPHIVLTDDTKVHRMMESWLYETAEFGKEGRLCEMDDWKYYDLGAVGFSVFAFAEGMSWIFWDKTGRDDSLCLDKRRSFSQKDAQVGLLFREKFAPLFLKAEDPLEKCILAYRYFVSAYEFLGFRYAGRARQESRKLVIDDILESCGEEKGRLFVTCFCTAERYITGRIDPDAKRYAQRMEEHVREKYGESMWKEFEEFFMRYRGDAKFLQEAKFMAATKKDFIDDSLVL